MKNLHIKRPLIFFSTILGILLIIVACNKTEKRRVDSAPAVEGMVLPDQEGTFEVNNATVSLEKGTFKEAVIVTTEDVVDSDTILRLKGRDLVARPVNMTIKNQRSQKVKSSDVLVGITISFVIAPEYDATKLQGLVIVNDPFTATTYLNEDLKIEKNPEGSYVVSFITREPNCVAFLLYDTLGLNLPFGTPQVFSERPATNNQKPTWTWQTGGNSTGLYRYKFEDSNIEYAYTETKETSFTPEYVQFDGPHTLYVIEKNQDGDWSETGSYTVTVDTVKPNAPIVSGVTLSNDSTPSWTWSSGGGGNGTYRFKIDSNDFTNEEDNIYETTELSYTVAAENPLPSGTHYIYVQESDDALNWSDSGSFTTTLDVTAPSAPVVDGLSVTKNLRPTWTWTSSGGGNGKFRYKLSDSDLQSGATETTNTTFTPSSDLTAGNKTLYVQEQDDIGNWSESGKFTTYIDLYPPGMPTVSGTTPTGDSTPTWSWSSGGGGNGTYRYKLDSSDLSSGATETTDSSFTPGTPLSDEAHTLYVQERDSVENWSASGSKTITIDTTGPNPPNITCPSTTNNLRPTWDWTQGGGGSGYFRYKLDDPDLSTGATLISYKTITPGSDLSNGTHTLYVQERDSLFNWSSTDSCEIVVDSASPTPGNSGIITNDPPSHTEATLHWTSATDNLLPITYAVYQSTSNNLTSPNSTEQAALNGEAIKIKDYTAAITSFVVTNLEPSTTYYFNVIAKDTANNKETYTSISVITSDAELASGISTHDATANTAYRKTFYDSINLKHWAFYYNGSGIRYAYSSDNLTWTESGIQSLTGYNTSRFTVVTKGAYTFIALQFGYDIKILRGSLAATSITFGTEQIPLDGLSSISRYEFPGLAIDGNNKVVVAGFYLNDYGMYRAITKRTNVDFNATDGTWDAAVWSEIPESVFTSTSSAAGLSLISQEDSGKLILITQTAGNRILAYSYNGTNWVSASGNSYDWFFFQTGLGFNSYVKKIAISGSDIYAVGNFTLINGRSTNFIARWDGSSWHPLGSGTNSLINTIAVSGNDVYIGGNFTTAGGIGANYIAKWNGASWSALGNGLSASVNAIAISGSNVYVGGDFEFASGVTVNKIAKWDGSSWTPLGVGLDNSVQAISISGSDIYVGGSFTTAGGVPASRIAKYNGSTWSALDSGMDSGVVYAIAIDGSNNIYAGGQFTYAGEGPAVTVNNIAKFNGTEWNALDSGTDGTVRSIAIDGSNIYAGGQFTHAGDPAVTVNYIAKFDGTNWTDLASGMNSSPVYSVLISGSDIFAAGSFTIAGVQAANYIAKWNGAAWSTLTFGISGNINAMTTDGTNIYVGGDFVQIGGDGSIIVKYVAKWNGTNLLPLGSGVNGIVNALAWDPTASALIVGGEFTTAGGSDASRIAKWDGTNWYTLDESGYEGVNGKVKALAVSSSGSNIYVGGEFTSAGNHTTRGLAKYSGTTWTPFNTDIDEGTIINAIAISGSDLYVGGIIPSFNRIAKYNGSTWTALGAGIGNNSVLAIAVSGSNVYAGGNFTQAGGSSANYIAQWNGTTWSALGDGVSSAVNSISTFGSNVYVTGEFSQAGGSAAYNVARWNGTVWGALGNGIGVSTKANVISGVDLYVGGRNFIAQYRPVVATTSGSFSAAYNTNTDVLHLLYRSSAFGTSYKSWVNGGNWSLPTNLGYSNTAYGAVSLTLNTTTGDLYAFWANQSSIQTKTYTAAASSWSESPTTVPGGSSLSSNPLSDESYSSGNFSVIWSRLSGTTYKIFSYPAP